MALIVENGSGVPGANSYVSLADARLYAAARGLTIAEDDATAETQLVRAFDMIEGFERRFGGSRVYATSAFPRRDLWIYGVRADEDGIPYQAIYAQVQFAVAIESGVDLTPVISLGNMVIREKVGQLETEYAEPTSASALVPHVTAAMTNLSALFGTGNQRQLMLVRY